MATLNIDITDAIQKGAGEIINLLIDNYDRLGMRASGQWADSLEYEITSNSVIIKGLDYTQYLTQGRPPGGNPPVRAIYDWMQNKPGFTGEKTLGTAIAISRAIGKKGTSWYMEGGSNLVDILADPEVMRTFFGGIADVLRVQISQSILRDFKTLAT